MQASFPFWLYLTAVNDALHRLLPCGFARTKNCSAYIHFGTDYYKWKKTCSIILLRTHIRIGWQSIRHSDQLRCE